MDLEWEDPPTRQMKSAAWARETVAELKQHPGKWARVRTYDSQWNAASAAVKRMKELGCEALSRTDEGSKTIGVWARWPENAA